MATSPDIGALKYKFQQIWWVAIRWYINDSEIKSKKKQLECLSQFSHKNNINPISIKNVGSTLRESFGWALTWWTNCLLASTSNSDMTNSRTQYLELFSLRKVSPCEQMTEPIKGALFVSCNAIWFAITIKYYFPSLDFIPILRMTN